MSKRRNKTQSFPIKGDWSVHLGFVSQCLQHIFDAYESYKLQVDIDFITKNALLQRSPIRKVRYKGVVIGEGCKVEASGSLVPHESLLEKAELLYQAKVEYDHDYERLRSYLYFMYRKGFTEHCFIKVLTEPVYKKATESFNISFQFAPNEPLNAIDKDIPDIVHKYLGYQFFI